MTSRLHHPAEWALADYRERQGDGERLDALVLAFEHLLRVDALVLAAGFLADRQARSEQVWSLLQVRAFSLGHWHKLLQALTEVERGPFGRAMAAWLGEVSGACEGGAARSRRTQLKCTGRPIQSLLSLRNRRAHSESRTQPAFVAELAAIGACCIERCVAAHPPLGTFEEVAPGAVELHWEGERLPCGPFLLPGSLAGAPGELLLFGGLGAKGLEYAARTGVGHVDAAALAELKTQVARRSSVSAKLERGASVEALAQRCEDVTRGALERLASARRHPGGPLLARAEFDLKALDGLTGGGASVVLVEGPAGAGKSCWLAGLAEQRLARGEAVLLATTDRMGPGAYPDCLRPLLRVDFDPEEALARVASRSADGRLVLLLDDLGKGGEELAVLSSLLQWAEQLSARPEVRIAATVRPERVRAVAGRLEGSRQVLRLQLPPLEGYEIIELAEALPGPVGAEPTAGWREARREVAARLAAVRDAGSRRPGFAAALLDRIRGGGTASLVSVRELLGDVFRTDVLELDPATGKPGKPARGKALRDLAAALVQARATRLDINARGLEALVDASGGRTPAYDDLLSAGILVESLEDFDVRVGFADQRLFEFTAALDVRLEQLGPLLDDGAAYPSAGDVVAHVLAREAGKDGAARAVEAALRDGRAPFDVLVRLAAVDPPAFLRLAAPLAARAPTLALELARWLVDQGEYRVGLEAAARVAEQAAGADLVTEAFFQVGRAAYELDEYQRAAQALEVPGLAGTGRALVLMGETRASSGRFEEARQAYTRALEAFAPGEEPLLRAHAVRGRGLCLARLGQEPEAEAALREAIALLEPHGDSRHLAEALGDLGDFLATRGQLDEAEPLLRRGLEINERMRNPVGTGIARGQLGVLAHQQGRLADAEALLRACLEEARRTSNAWRQAWTMQRLAPVVRARGDAAQADRLQADAEAIDARISGT